MRARVLDEDRSFRSLRAVVYQLSVKNASDQGRYRNLQTFSHRRISQASCYSRVMLSTFYSNFLQMRTIQVKHGFSRITSIII